VTLAAGLFVAVVEATSGMTVALVALVSAETVTLSWRQDS